MYRIEVEILEGIISHGVNLSLLNNILFVGQIPPGLMLEFGVGEGGSIRIIGKLTERTVYGFDWFKGLPEDWREGDLKGRFACDVPTNLPKNVKLVIGLFDETLPTFLAEHKDPVAFAHIDCDLLSSTRTVLNAIKDRLQIGTILAFDEILGTKGCFDHEFRAFTEFLADNPNVKVECLGRQGPEAATFRVVKCDT